MNTQQLQTSHFMDKGLVGGFFGSAQSAAGWSPILSTGVCETYIFSCPFVFPHNICFQYKLVQADTRIF